LREIAVASILRTRLRKVARDAREGIEVSCE
jgi:hypothetical protein